MFILPTFNLQAFGKTYEMFDNQIVNRATNLPAAYEVNSKKVSD